MAVTQQLARLTSADLDRCRESVGALDDLCSFKLLPASDHLDLDWSTRRLERLAKQVDSALAAGIETACSGGAEINPAYKEWPGSVWEHPVRALEPDEVAAVSCVLKRWRPSDLTETLPADEASARRIVELNDFDGHPRHYLATHFAALREFFSQAAAAGLAIATWWD